ncbi:MAG TPA: sodium:solute symporter family protein [Longimicrobiales bacterium]
MQPLDYTVLIAYVGAMLGIGWMVSRTIGSFRDWFVASGTMTTPLLVCTLVSTYYGLDVLFGGSELAYEEGVVAWFWYSRPYYFAILLTALLLARRLKQRDFLSLPDIVAERYGRGTQTIVALASFVYSLPLLSIMGLGVLFDVMLGIPFVWGVLLGAGVATIYTLMGGIMADALTDTIQFVLMCVALAIAAIVVLGDTGGIDAMRASLPAEYFEPRGTYPLTVLLVYSLAALSVLVEPAFYQRVFAAVSARAVIAALLIGMALWAAFDWIVTVLGIGAAAQGLEVEGRYALLEVVLPALPAGLAGLFVASVLATAMSTIDSYLLISGGNLAYDLYRPWRARDIDDARLLRLTRYGVVGASAVSVLFALFFESMVAAWIFMATVLVVTALIPVLAALYVPRLATRAAGIASALTGLGVAALYSALVRGLGTHSAEWDTTIWRTSVLGADVALWQEYAVIVALPASLLAFAIGSLFGRRVGQENIR